MSEPSSNTEWHGWSVGDSPAIHVGYLPRRKSPCLYMVDGSELRVLAYFRDEESARECLDLLDGFFGRPYGVLA